MSRLEDRLIQMKRDFEKQHNAKRHIHVWQDSRRAAVRRAAPKRPRAIGPKAGEIFWDKLFLSMVLYGVDKFPHCFPLTRLNLP